MGSTAKRFLASLIARDHPHIHGEHDFIILAGVGALGSPPYTWGAPGSYWGS